MSTIFKDVKMVSIGLGEEQNAFITVSLETLLIYHQLVLYARPVL